jgi:hypothetical protein
MMKKIEEEVPVEIEMDKKHKPCLSDFDSTRPCKRSSKKKRGH